MGEVINLRLVRKRRARVAAGVRATENRRVFGRTAAEKAADAAARKRIEKILDGAQLDDEPADATSDKKASLTVPPHRAVILDSIQDPEPHMPSVVALDPSVR